VGHCADNIWCEESSSTSKGSGEDSSGLAGFSVAISARPSAVAQLTIRRRDRVACLTQVKLTWWGLRRIEAEYKLRPPCNGFGAETNGDVLNAKRRPGMMNKPFRAGDGASYGFWKRDGSIGCGLLRALLCKCIYSSTGGILALLIVMALARYLQTPPSGAESQRITRHFFGVSLSKPRTNSLAASRLPRLLLPRLLLPEYCQCARMRID